MIFTAIVYERRTENTEGNHVTKIHNVVQFTGQMNKSQWKFIFLLVESANSALQIPVSIAYSATKYVYILSCYQKAEF